MLSYCSLEYLIVFLPAVMILYQILPKQARRILLLAASYAFFWYLSGILVLWNVAVAVIVYLTGLRMSALLNRRDRDLKQRSADRRRRSAPRASENCACG